MLKQVVSLLMLLSATIMVATGIIMFVMPGHGPAGAGHKVLGLSRMQITNLHITFMIPFVIATILHIALNAKSLVAYCRSCPKPALPRNVGIAIALGVTLVFVAGTIADAPPFSNFVQWGRSLSHGAPAPGARFGPGGPWAQNAPVDE